MNAKTAPPARNNGPARLAQKRPLSGTWVAHKVAAPSRVIPAAMTSLAGARVMRICAGPASPSAVSEVASHATPVFRAEYPSTCCMYRVPMKKRLKKLAPSRKLTAFDPARVFSRNRRSGSSGASARVSMTRKPASSAADAASRPRVRAAVHPMVLPDSPTERHLAGRFAAAVEDGDIDAVLTMLTSDAWLTMPPEPYEYQGPAAIAAFLRHRARLARRPAAAGAHPGQYPARLRLLPALRPHPHRPALRDDHPHPPRRPDQRHHLVLRQQHLPPLRAPPRPAAISPNPADENQARSSQRWPPARRPPPRARLRNTGHGPLTAISA